jgi:CheY-like chemotaxis protein
VIDDASYDDETTAILREAGERSGRRHVPIVLYSDSPLEQPPKRARDTKGLSIIEAKSKAELLEDASLFLHQTLASMNSDQRQILNQIRQKDPSLRGRKVLIVDDDIRNIFSLTSVLEQHDIRVIYAENGRDGVQVLLDDPDIDVALIDIMMPDMDGYQTMEMIRQHDALRGIPLIAVTAKAMKGDRQKCIQAGAADYISKPVDVDHLLSLIRVWIRRGQIHAIAGE